MPRALGGSLGAGRFLMGEVPLYMAAELVLITVFHEDGDLLQQVLGDPLLHSERVQGFAADPVYGRAKCLPMLGSLKT